MNWNLVGSIYGRFSLKSVHFVMIHYQTWPSTSNSCFWLANFFLNVLVWNRFAKLTETWQEASMECPLWRLLILSRSVNKHCHHRQFLFLIGWYLKKSSPLKLPSQMNRNLVGSIYMYGRLCIKFPQSRMKVSDTGSAHWASGSSMKCTALLWLDIEVTKRENFIISALFFIQI